MTHFYYRVAVYAKVLNYVRMKKIKGWLNLYLFMSDELPEKLDTKLQVQDSVRNQKRIVTKDAKSEQKTSSTFSTKQKK